MAHPAPGRLALAPPARPSFAASPSGPADSRCIRGPPVRKPAATMTRQELIRRTRQLVAEGDRLVENPSLEGLRTWLQLSDDLLAAAWGSMDRYHLAWLQVGRPAEIVRGRPMTEAEAEAYVREVATAKTAVLRMSVEAVARRGMPFVGETRD